MLPRARTDDNDNNNNNNNNDDDDDDDDYEEKQEEKEEKKKKKEVQGVPAAREPRRKAPTIGIIAGLSLTVRHRGSFFKTRDQTGLPFPLQPRDLFLSLLARLFPCSMSLLVLPLSLSLSLSLSLCLCLSRARRLLERAGHSIRARQRTEPDVRRRTGF